MLASERRVAHAHDQHLLRSYSKAIQTKISFPGLLVLLYSLPSMHYPAKTLCRRGETNFFKKQNKPQASLAFHLYLVAPGCFAVILSAEAVASSDIKCITFGHDERGPHFDNFVPACYIVNYLLGKRNFSLWRQLI